MHIAVTAHCNSALCYCRLLHKSSLDIAHVHDLPDSWLPNLTKAGQKLFQDQRESWWCKFTTITDLCRPIHHPFAHRIATDGTSVSVTFERTSVAAAASQQAEAALQGRSNPAAASVADKDWVRGPGRPVMTAHQRIVGIDPGDKAVFTAVVHAAAAEQTLPNPCPARYKSQL